MAKSKEFEKEYQAEKLRRTVIRKAARRALRKVNKRYRHAECPDCGGQMSWCSCCEQWSQYCCQEYGTCQCS